MHRAGMHHASVCLSCIMHRSLSSLMHRSVSHASCIGLSLMHHASVCLSLSSLMHRSVCLSHPHRSARAALLSASAAGPPRRTRATSARWWKRTRITHRQYRACHRASPPHHAALPNPFPPSTALSRRILLYTSLPNGVGVHLVVVDALVVPRQAVQERVHSIGVQSQHPRLRRVHVRRHHAPVRDRRRRRRRLRGEAHRRRGLQEAVHGEKNCESTMRVARGDSEMVLERRANFRGVRVAPR
jgi:hypothetical protein